MSGEVPSVPAEEPEDPWSRVLRRNREAVQRMRQALAERDSTPNGTPCE